MFDDYNLLYKEFDTQKDKALIELNKQMELAKMLYIEKAKENKNDYIKDNIIQSSEELNKEVSKKNFDAIKLICSIYFAKVSKYYYDESIKYLNDKIKDKNFKNKYDPKSVDKYMNAFIEGFGLNYSFNTQISQYENYFNSRVTNTITLMLVKNKGNLEQSNDTITNTDMEKFVKETDIDYVTEFMREKKMLSNLFDSTMNSTMKASIKQAFIDCGIDYIYRRGIADKVTCDYCLSIMNKRFGIQSAPSVPSHPNCRCWYEPDLDKYIK